MGLAARQEWRRFEAGLEARTNQDVREAKQLRAMARREMAIAAQETPEQRQARDPRISGSPCCPMAFSPLNKGRGE